LFLIFAVVFIIGGIIAFSATVHKLPQLTVMPVEGIAAYIMSGLSGLFVLIVLWRVVTLRMIRALFTLIAAIIISYYPAAYGFHYYWFNYQVPSMQGRQPMSGETFVVEHWTIVDYSILGISAFLGLLLLSMMMDEHEWPFRGSRPPSLQHTTTGSTNFVPLVWGLLGFFACPLFSIIAIVSAHSALRYNPNDQAARAGLILGWAVVLLYVLCIIVYCILYGCLAAVAVLPFAPSSPQ
jgi:hypothetical protein